MDAVSSGMLGLLLQQMNTSTIEAPLNTESHRPLSLVRSFTLSAGFILTITALAKVWSAFGGSKLVAVPDPITGISFGNLMLVVGILELVIAGVCLFSKSQKLPLALIAWLATNFVVYRLGLWWVGWKKPCSCLGNLTDVLHISPQLADNIIKVILAYLLIGSYGLLFWQWQFGRLTPRLQSSDKNACFGG